jgi:hypothetical protein
MDEHDHTPAPPEAALPQAGQMEPESFETAATPLPVPTVFKGRRKRSAYPPLTLTQFRELETVLLNNGYREMIDWSEGLRPPRDAKAFALEAIYVICNSGMRFAVANGIYWKCVRALRRRQSAASVFGHPGKARAIDFIWQNRTILFAAYQIAENKVSYCAGLPWIGPVTKYHLAKNLGLDFAKPDVHLARLAAAEHSTVVELCDRLSEQTGYRVTTIDSVLWRACADGYIESATYRTQGWRAASEKLREALSLIRPVERMPADD